MEETKVVLRDTGDGRNVELTATQPSQLPDLQLSLTQWAERRLQLAIAEADDAADVVSKAATSGFELKPLERLANRADNRRRYYEKVLAALKAGYVLMPTLDADLFAVRTDRKKPPYQLVKFKVSDVSDVDARALAIGLGRYVSPQPLVRETTTEHTRQDWQTKKDITETVQAYVPTAMDEEIPFPLVMAKPEIMKSTTRAMLLKIFDEIGLIPPARNTDPVIVGRIIRPNQPKWFRSVTTFLIAWHVDTRQI